MKGKEFLHRILTVFSIVFVVIMVAIYSHSLFYNAFTRYSRDWFGWDKEEYLLDTQIFYKTQTDSYMEQLEKSKEIAIQVQAEGSALLKNDGALPLLTNERKVSLFGVASENAIHGGTGSGTGNVSLHVDLFTAFSERGIQINPTLKAFYEAKYKQGYRRGEGTDMNGAYYGIKGTRSYGYSINEVEREAYTDEVRASYQEYDDVALILFSRSAGEGQDLPTSMTEFYEGDSKSYLELTDEEVDLLEEVKDGGFRKIVVLVNAMNAMDLSILGKDEKINIILYIGGVGNYGFYGVADLLLGKSNPSGRLADTYADPMSAPAMQNYGDNRYLDGGEKTTAAYVAYAENIYVGYRYYETRYADKMMQIPNVGEFDYDEVVTYPFGYGLSYTQFEWRDFTVKREGEKLFASVSVQNVGKVAGKDVVELYVQKPYTAYDRQMGVEKSAIDLVGYQKTQLLEPNQTQTLTIELRLSDLTSYDTYGVGSYLLEAGTYYFTVAKNAHVGVQNILNEVGMYALNDGNVDLVEPFEQLETKEYSVSESTGYTIQNQFEREDYSSVPDDLTFLSRQDWVGTWPTVYGEEGSQAGSAVKVMTQEKKAQILSTENIGKNDEKTDYIYSKSTGKESKILIEKPKTNSGEGIYFSDLFDENGKAYDYEDPIWMKAVECMTIEELYRYTSYGFAEIADIPSLHKLRSTTSDTPMGLYGGTLFPCYPIQAGTWNVELATQLGNALSQEGLWMKVSGWYAPALNTHRTPFSGRNYEYYSEDGFLGGYYAAHVVKAVQKNGLFTHLKHFALNDQDTNRGDRGNFANHDPYNGLCTYANEQTIREIYLKSFRLAVEKGGAHGVMTSYNRIGDIWAGGHYGLLTEVLRNEWGMEGVALTDYAGTFGYKYMNMPQGLMAGNNQWLYPQDEFPNDRVYSDSNVYYMQKAAKNILFAEANSNRVNGQRMTSGESIPLVRVVYTWEWIFGCIGVLCFLYLFIRACTIKK